MGGYLLLSYGTAWGIWLMCGMMPPGAVTAQLLNTVVDGIKEINDALNELHAAHLAIRDLTDELGPIPGCRSPGCAALFWRISPGF